MKFSFLSRYGFQYLLVCFFLYILIGPFLESVHYDHVILDIFLTSMLILSVLAIRKKVKLLSGTIALLSVTLLLIWINTLGIFELSDRSANLVLCLFLFFLVYSFSHYIFSAKRVEANLISAALCFYLFLGILWGTIYVLVESFVPGSFGGELLDNAASPTDQRHYFYYISYITLTTLGYGDILPRTTAATALCQVEAILGQFFTAVLVARLVGIQVSQQFIKEEHKELSDGH